VQPLQDVHYISNLSPRTKIISLRMVYHSFINSACHIVIHNWQYCPPLHNFFSGQNPTRVTESLSQTSFNYLLFWLISHIVYTSLFYSLFIKPIKCVDLFPQSNQQFPLLQGKIRVLASRQAGKSNNFRLWH
jgi:hypothetical protein